MRNFLRAATLLSCLAFLPNCVVHVNDADDPADHASEHRPRHKRPRRMRRPRKAAPSRRVAKTKAKTRVRPAPRLVTQPPRRSPPRSSARPYVMAPGVGTGRPDGFRPGAPAAYWIWQGPRGRWRVRTTTARLLRHFQGHVQSMTSVLSGFDPNRVELRDQLWLDKPGWAFSFKTKGHADGFTFAAKDNGCVKFDLVLGRPRNKPARIFVGRGQAKPAGGNFIVCPKGRVPIRGPVKRNGKARRGKGKPPAARPGAAPRRDTNNQPATRRGGR